MISSLLVAPAKAKASATSVACTITGVVHAEEAALEASEVIGHAGNQVPALDALLSDASEELQDVVAGHADHGPVLHALLPTAMVLEKVIAAPEHEVPTGGSYMNNSDVPTRAAPIACDTARTDGGG